MTVDEALEAAMAAMERTRLGGETSGGQRLYLKGAIQSVNQARAELHNGGLCGIELIGRPTAQQSDASTTEGGET